MLYSKTNIIIILLCLCFTPIFSLKTNVNITLQLAKKHFADCVHFIADANNSKINEMLVIPKKFRAFSFSTAEKFSRDSRQDCKRPLFVSYSSAWTDEEYKVELGESTSDSTWLLFLDTADTIYGLFKHVDIRINSKFIVAIRNSEKIQFYSIYKVNKIGILHINDYATWTPSEGIVYMKMNMNRRDLEGTVFRAGTNVGLNLDDMDIVEEVHISAKPEEFILYIWEALRSTMNFTSVKLWMDASVGSHQNGTWTGLIGALLSGEIDVLLSDFNLDSGRTKVLSTAHSILTSRYGVYTESKGNGLGLLGPLKPLQLNVWIFILLWIVGGAFIFLLTERLSSRYLGSSELVENYPSSIFLIWQSLSMQGCSSIPKTSPSRIIFIISYLLSSLLLPLYSASLISSLTQRGQVKPFNSLSGLIEEGYTLRVNKHSADYNFFTLSNISLYKEIAHSSLKGYSVTHRIPNTNAYVQMMFKICTEKRTAIFAAEYAFEYYMNVKNYGSLCDVVKIDEKLPTLHQSLALPKGCPYMEIFNYRILQLSEFGIIDRYWKNYQRVKGRDKNYQQYAEISIPDTFAIFLALIFGMFLSIMFFLCEVRTHRNSTYRSKKEESSEKVTSATFTLSL